MWRGSEAIPSSAKPWGARAGTCPPKSLLLRAEEHCEPSGCRSWEGLELSWLPWPLGATSLSQRPSPHTDSGSCPVLPCTPLQCHSPTGGGDTPPAVLVALVNSTQ